MPSWSDELLNAFGGMTDQPLPELVVLLEEPMTVGVEFVQGALEAALQVSFPAQRPDSEEFVTGEFPIFMAQTGGRLLQLKFMFLSYFDEECRPFVNGDADALLASLNDKAEKRAARNHKGWIAVSLMNPGSLSGDETGYELLGKVLAALAIVADPLAIVDPQGARIRAWDFDLFDTLQSDDPLQVFDL